MLYGGVYPFASLIYNVRSICIFTLKPLRILCYIAIRKLGYKCSDVSKTVGISAATVSKAVGLGSKLSQIGKLISDNASSKDQLPK